jgi:hypothetical protein
METQLSVHWRVEKGRCWENREAGKLQGYSSKLIKYPDRSWLLVIAGAMA